MAIVEVSKDALEGTGIEVCIADVEEVQTSDYDKYVQLDHNIEVKMHFMGEVVYEGKAIIIQEGRSDGTIVDFDLLPKVVQEDIKEGLICGSYKGGRR